MLGAFVETRTASRTDSALPGNPSSSLEQLNNPPALPFSLKPVLDLDALEQVVKQEKDAVLISCKLEVAEVGRQDGLGNENADEPPSAHCVADPASGADLVTNESPGHLSKEDIPNNAELQPCTPSVVHAKAVQRKRSIYGDHVPNDAKATRRSERFHESSPEKSESSATPESITESDYGPGTSRPKRIRAETRHPAQCDPSDNGTPSQNAPKGATCQKSAQGGGTTKTRQCPSCSKVLSRKYNLNRHRQLVHEGLRPFKCPHCAMSFGEKASLRSHIRRVHTGERPTFFQYSGLQKHLMWHITFLCFACDLCSIEFVLKEHLKRHVRTHTGARSFACPHCPRRLSTLQTLKRHRLTHVDDWQHQCEVCDRRFHELRTLRDHARSRHPTEICFD
ncbi:hypothetical protein HPB52_015182 [Rhipicephalus sanguineus]|uniref:C2H2-type domain-containing protein n=1 Tax=Rhipicephalus sanguineus TaxID=34632 RepID=A0A9D4SNJ5_RHISA|nr:hypothetical protein HPB52_015182 [Rhipicephalus sanguineus]